jgi:plastocyanin
VVGLGFCLGLSLGTVHSSAAASGEYSLPFAETTVTVQNFSFSPTPVTMNVGDTVKWNWVNGFHSVVFADGPTSGPPTSTTGIHYQRTFEAPGIYDYICGVHGASMSGRVTIAAPFATISGHVSGPQGQALPATAVTLTPSAGPKRRVRTNDAGDYVISDVPTNQSYSIVPRSRVYSFTPQDVNVSGNLTNIDFTGQPQLPDVEEVVPAQDRTKRRN